MSRFIKIDAKVCLAEQKLLKFFGFCRPQAIKA
jgi:hypothetical protein